jgi:N-acyl-D-amino-acid deacylase
MTRVVARRRGFYASHIRNEEAALLEAVNEAIEIGRRTGARVQISHLKAAGKPNWDKQWAALDLIASARAAGVDALADAYPYTAYSTGLTIFLETWAREGDEEALVARLHDSGTRRRIRTATAARVLNDPGGFELIVISRVRTEKNRAVVGMNLVEIAEAWSVEPVDALLRLLEEESGGVGFIGHGMSEANVEMVLAHPLVMIGSDGVSMAPVGKAAETRPHPRSYCAFARVLRRYVRERKLFDLPTAIRKMTSMPADQVGLRDRGRLARGWKADVVAFDAAGIGDRATFEKPHQYAGGVVHVLVNGKFVVERGHQTEARPGTVLPKS